LPKCARQCPCSARKAAPRHCEAWLGDWPLAAQEEAAVLHDELQARDALRGAPADPEITILERVKLAPPDQQRDSAAIALDELTQIIADGPAGAEVMVVG
jgi:hypothetical protein